MIQKRFSISLDIKRPTSNKDFVVVEGDNGNILEVTLTDDGTAVDLSDCLVCAVFSKSNGTAQQDNNGHGITVDTENTNQLTIELYTGSFAPGLVECELQVYSGTDNTTIVTSAKFNFNCRRGIANEDTITSNNEWPLLVDALERTEAVEAAEALRVTAEGLRVDAETARDTAEGLRDTAEGLRDTAETARASAETARTTAEGLRDTSEGLRATAETSRASAETERDTAEGLRDTSEGLRASAETSRESAETARASAETLRETAETDRAARDTAFGLFENYNPLTAYVPLNKAYYLGSTYQCILASTGNLPTNTTYWKIIASKGADGAGAGDMLASVYDPTNVSGDAFLLSNMTDDATHRLVTDTEKSTWNGKASAADVDALEAAETVILLSGTGPAFTTTEPLPAAGKKRTLKFPAAATSATVEFATGGAKNVYAYGTTAFKPKANQVVEVVYDGTNFTVCSAGGGAELPATIEAGDDVIHSNFVQTQINDPGTSYVPQTGNYRLTIHKAGTYRVRYYFYAFAGTVVACVYRSGALVSGTPVTTSSTVVSGTFDVSASENDTLQLAVKGTTAAADIVVCAFAVSINAADWHASLGDVFTAG